MFRHSECLNNVLLRLLLELKHQKAQIEVTSQTITHGLSFRENQTISSYYKSDMFLWTRNVITYTYNLVDIADIAFSLAPHDCITARSLQPDGFYSSFSVLSSDIPSSGLEELHGLIISYPLYIHVRV